MAAETRRPAGRGQVDIAGGAGDGAGVQGVARAWEATAVSAIVRGAGFFAAVGVAAIVGAVAGERPGC